MQFLDIKWLGFEEGKNADEKVINSKAGSFRFLITQI